MLRRRGEAVVEDGCEQGGCLLLLEAFLSGVCSCCGRLPRGLHPRLQLFEGGLGHSLIFLDGRRWWLSGRRGGGRGGGGGGRLRRRNCRGCCLRLRRRRVCRKRSFFFALCERL